MGVLRAKVEHEDGVEDLVRRCGVLQDMATVSMCIRTKSTEVVNKWIDGLGYLRERPKVYDTPCTCNMQTL